MQRSFRFVSETTFKITWANGMYAKRCVGETISHRTCQFINFMSKRYKFWCKDFFRIVYGGSIISKDKNLTPKSVTELLQS